jgi:hypothetical protein
LADLGRVVRGEVLGSGNLFIFDFFEVEGTETVAGAMSFGSG